MSNQEPSHTAGIEGGTNQTTILQRMFRKNNTILDTELDAVPMDRAAGICAPGKTQWSAGIKIKLAPPPHTALSEKAKKEKMKRSIPDNSMTKSKS